MILAILAAGMGSRYGGLKQIDPITDDGDFIIDFSIYDAIQAGFDQVVFIIKRENYEAFHETVGKRVSKYIKTAYAFQDLEDLPEGCSVPAGRVKPWGTTHAVLAARELLTENFAVINSDDFYGRDAFLKLAAHLRQPAEHMRGHYCMVGYVLRNTLTDFGTVSRGECVIDKTGHLCSVTERKKIARQGNDAVFTDDGNEIPLSGNTVVSMNFWGFGPDAIAHFKNDFDAFMHSSAAKECKSECFLPETVDRMMKAGLCDVTVDATDAVWHGVTYAEDKPNVVRSVRKLIEAGEYPAHLWGENHEE